ncbi:MAG: hypothetical protein MI861_24370, partial [Pirellulales bacterium]|nr:hypothetical protein [Pirellulales bacterium]
DDDDDDDDARRRVRVSNQFSDRQTLRVMAAELLLVPSTKGENGDPPADPSGLNLDHFQCYEADGRTVDATVNLEDQFGLDSFEVGEPELYCQVADKNGEGVIDEAFRLTCYEIESDDDDDVDRLVSISNQLARQALELEEPELLCVPSTELDVTVPQDDDDEDDDNDDGDGDDDD